MSLPSDLNTFMMEMGGQWDDCAEEWEQEEQRTFRHSPFFYATQTWNSHDPTFHAESIVNATKKNHLFRG